MNVSEDFIIKIFIQDLLTGLPNSVYDARIQANINGVWSDWVSPNTQGIFEFVGLRDSNYYSIEFRDTNGQIFTFSSKGLATGPSKEAYVGQFDHEQFKISQFK